MFANPISFSIPTAKTSLVSSDINKNGFSYRRAISEINPESVITTLA